MRSLAGKPLGVTSQNQECPAEVKAPSIMDQLGIIEQNLSDTGNLINILYNKLAPVMRCSGPTADNGADKTSSSGEVVRQLVNITEAIQNYNNAIDDIINRLEIS
jgi:hypothetical protein